MPGFFISFNTAKSCSEFFIHAEGMADDNAVSRFANWFHGQNNWLVIFDDAGEKINIETLLPKIGGGHIIIDALPTQAQINTYPVGAVVLVYDPNNPYVPSS